MSRSDLLNIPRWKAETIENALRLCANQLGCRTEKTALDREVMLAIKHVKDLILTKDHKDNNG